MLRKIGLIGPGEITLSDYGAYIRIDDVRQVGAQ